MVYKTKCLNCSQFRESFGYYCNMECSIKGKQKIFPSTFTMKDISNCLENNIGITISKTNISIYVREIKNLISE